MSANTKTERVKFYIQNFMSLHEKGYKVPEIAEICKVSRGHAYKLLQEIADANGVTRDELLLVKGWHKSQTGNSTKVIRRLVDGNALHAEFEKVVCDVDSIIKEIDKMITL